MIYHGECRHYVTEKTRSTEMRGNDRRGAAPRPGTVRAGSLQPSFPPRRGKLSHNILPPPGVLEAYNQLVDGSAERLFDMSEVEQRHRHTWEDNYLRSHVISYRLGQIFGFTSILAIVTGTVVLAFSGQGVTASVLAGAGFTFLAVTAVVSARGRRFARRPSRDGEQSYHHNSAPRRSYENEEEEGNN